MSFFPGFKAKSEAFKEYARNKARSWISAGSSAKFGPLKVAAGKYIESTLGKDDWLKGGKAADFLYVMLLVHPTTRKIMHIQVEDQIKYMEGRMALMDSPDATMQQVVTSLRSELKLWIEEDVLQTNKGFLFAFIFRLVYPSYITPETKLEDADQPSLFIEEYTTAVGISQGNLLSSDLGLTFNVEDLARAYHDHVLKRTPMGRFDMETIEVRLDSGYIEATKNFMERKEDLSGGKLTIMHLSTPGNAHPWTNGLAFLIKPNETPELELMRKALVKNDSAFRPYTPTGGTKPHPFIMVRNGSSVKGRMVYDAKDKSKAVAYASTTTGNIETYAKLFGVAFFPGMFFNQLGMDKIGRLARETGIIKPIILCHVWIVFTTNKIEYTPSSSASGASAGTVTMYEEKANIPEHYFCFLSEKRAAGMLKSTHALVYDTTTGLYTFESKKKLRADSDSDSDRSDSDSDQDQDSDDDDEDEEDERRRRRDARKNKNAKVADVVDIAVSSFDAASLTDQVASSGYSSMPRRGNLTLQEGQKIKEVFQENYEMEGCKHNFDKTVPYLRILIHRAVQMMSENGFNVADNDYYPEFASVVMPLAVSAAAPIWRMPRTMNRVADRLLSESDRMIGEFMSPVDGFTHLPVNGETSIGSVAPILLPLTLDPKLMKNIRSTDKVLSMAKR